MNLRVRYHRASDVQEDRAQQLARGGLLVRVEAEPEQFSSVQLELIAGADVVTIDAQVVQVFAGSGVAVTFAPTEALRRWFEAVATFAGDGDRDAEHAVATAGVASSEAPGAPSTDAARGGDPGAKVQLALHGNRDERAAILRETNPTLHLHVLRNPGLQLDEVAAIAKLRTVSPELLKQIADRREWGTRPEIALALVRNPKTPVPLAIRMLEHVPASELRTLAKDQHTRTPIQQAARKKVLG